jgi:hypothetical protein
MIIEKKTSDILFQSASTLTEDEWRKGSYFQVGERNGEKIPCRCAHGQIQWCGREKGFQEKIRNKAADGIIGARIGEELEVGIRVLAGVGVELGENKNGTYLGRNLQQWLDYYQQNYPSAFNRPLFLAHYYATKVGLTFEFNDDPSTTYEQVVAKLHEASTLAASEGN